MLAAHSERPGGSSENRKPEQVVGSSGSSMQVQEFSACRGAAAQAVRANGSRRGVVVAQENHGTKCVSARKKWMLRRQTAGNGPCAVQQRRGDRRQCKRNGARNPKENLVNDAAMCTGVMQSAQVTNDKRGAVVPRQVPWYVNPISSDTHAEKGACGGREKKIAGTQRTR